ncbi:hypothetical protein EPJ64_00480 [Brachyspira aalborgi]|uniref:hypothetical protein n=1 Tax=Brachyspira aalborgi TaxID=29522 RepID=UPI0011C9B62D|nr:hypothetical protein [Brachyspira aalborgi]TXJ17313.1 hypothetical protein EPJ77_00210 [Brachyspira aalborgi]TXJ22906.1 hypothetical protein EPJ64_00480 [Brachyspira aalborgi]
MKKAIILLMLLSVNLFPQKIGFQSFGLSIPLVGSLADYKIEKHGGNVSKENYESKSTFEGGLLLKAGYSFILKQNEPYFISLLFDFGYYRDAFGFMNYINNRKEVNVFDSLNMGFFAEGLFGFFTLGFGGGIKVPLGGSLRYDNIIELLNYGRLKNRFDDLYIPYIKFIIGLRYDSAYAGGGSSLSFYFNYDFPKVRVRGVDPDKQRLSSIDLGVQIGFHFGSYEYID